MSITNSFVAGNAVQIGSVGGNVTLALDRPDYQVQWLAPTPPPTYTPQRHRTPSSLLDTKREVVPYRHRPAEEQRLLDWLATDAPSSVLLLHGAGGRGKTRLANAFAAHSHATGWSVAHALNRVTDKPWMLPTGTPNATTPGQGVLVAVDYAERWPADVLLTLITDLSRTHPTEKVRVLLLARSIQDLWQPLCDQLDRTPIELPEPIELVDLTDSPDARTWAFTEAAQAFHAALGLTGACPTAPPDLAHDDYASPLILHMTALAAVCAERDHEELPNRDELSGYLLAHERRSWPPHPNGGDAVFLAILFGPIDSEDNALELLQVAGVTDSTATSRSLLTWHDRVYPAPRTTLSPLLPDRFGEDFVAEHLKSYPRAAALIERVTQSHVFDSSAFRRPTAVLVAAAARHPHMCTTLWQVLPKCFGLYHTPSAELVQLAIAHAPFDIRTLLHDRLPGPKTGMRKLGLELTRSLMNDMTDDTPDQTRAGIFMNAASRLADVGSDHTLVLELAHRSTSLIMAAWRDGSNDLQMPAAQIVLNGGAHFAKAGDLPRALLLTETAIKILRRVNPDDRTDRDINLVCALNNLSNQLWQLDRTDEAEVAATEALELAERNTGFSLRMSDLAGAAALLSRRFATWKKMSEAVRASKVGAEIYLRLAHQSPEFYARHATVSLNEYATYVAMAGTPDQALIEIVRAIQIARRSLDADIEGFERELPQLLHNAAEIGLMTPAASNTSQAHAWATEAAERYRALLPSHPDLRPRLTEVLKLLREIDGR
ncbi:hypothetical protein ACWGE0_17075 [Lentzea sp. NPDC054927]